MDGKFYYIHLSKNSGTFRKLDKNEKIRLKEGMGLELGDNEFEIIKVIKGKSLLL